MKFSELVIWRKKNKEDLMWVSGGIDSNLHIVAHECYDDLDEAIHTPEERAMTTWRYDCKNQEFMYCFSSRVLFDDEYFKVLDWLDRRGYIRKEN